jgi:uncharacterized protein YPO0396
MASLETKIAELKVQYPTLTKGINDQVISLSDDEYKTTIAKWAEYELQQEVAEAEKVQSEADKAALLSKLGITADEAKLLLS